MSTTKNCIYHCVTQSGRGEGHARKYTHLASNFLKNFNDQLIVDFF